jgi:hypothetical protein
MQNAIKNLSPVKDEEQDEGARRMKNLIFSPNLVLV